MENTTPVVAVIGGGQLARMMAEEASALGIPMRALVESADGSTAQSLPESLVGAADDRAKVDCLVAGAWEAGGGVPAHVVTYEHEHQDDQHLRALLEQGVKVEPRPDALLLARDKVAMRREMSRLKLPQPAWCEVSGSEQEIRDGIEAFAGTHGWPVVLKTPRGGYDGHGVLLVREAGDLRSGEAATWIAGVAQGSAAAQVGGGGSLGGAAVHSLLVEQAVPFTRELAVLVARRRSGEISAWPVVESLQSDGMCAEVVAPAPGLSTEAMARCQEIARTIAQQCDVTGVLAVEMFAIEEAGQPTQLLINELAMRPHNSGHWTQDGSVTSQFAQHLRAVADLPLGSTRQLTRATVMVNYIGGATQPDQQAYRRALAVDPDASIHLYGKQWRPGRKLGHVSISLPGSPEDPASLQEIEALRARGRAVVAALRGEDQAAQAN